MNGVSFQIGSAAGASAALAGVEVRDGEEGVSVAQVWAAGRISRVFRDAAGAVSRFHVTAPEAAATGFALVIADDGQVLGVTEPQTRRPTRELALLSVAASPSRVLATFQQPTFEGLTIVPVTLDTDPAEYDFVVTVADPFGQLREPRLHIQPTERPDRRQPADRCPGTNAKSTACV